MTIASPKTELKLAIIFDMDGVLIDSEPAWKLAEQDIFGALGVPLTEPMTNQTTGLRIDEVVEYWRARYPFNGDTGVIGASITEAVARWVRDSGDALPGVTPCLEAIVAENLPLGLATSSAPPLIEAVLERLGLQGTFGAIVSGSEVPRGKPDPAIYELCAQRLGVAVGRCVAIEDSVAGVTSARRAGLACVAVGSPLISKSDMLKAGAARWVETLEKLDISELCDLCEPPG
jgi:HAD superfamily hydrolase (TIGR01509 family)